MAASEKFHLNPAHGVILVDLGLDPSDVLRAADLPADLFARKKITLAPTEFYRFWETVERMAQIDHVPLAVGQGVSVESFDPLLFAVLSSPNLGVALSRMSDYKALLGPMSIDLKESGESLQVDISYRPAELQPPPGLMLFELVFLTHLARVGSRHQVMPLTVSAPELPENAAPYAQFMGVPITRGALSLTYSREDVERPFVTANANMWDFFEPELRRRVADLKEGASVAERVRAALHELLPTGGGSIEDVAKKLGTSKRTLQRRLKGETTSFQAQLDSTREKLAKHYLGRSKMSGAEIAFLLGFEDPNSFTRAFHNWTGSTPETMRQQLQAEPMSQMAS